MEAFDRLLEAINTYRLEHGEQPHIKISRAFWEENADDIARICTDDIDLTILDYLWGERSFIFSS